MNKTILTMEGVRKVFPGIIALDEVELTVREGEVHALIGENGAGKSTLVKILTGVYTPEAGVIRLYDKEITFGNPQESQAAGISAIHQEAIMFSDLSVTENIFMGHHIKNAKTGLLDWRTMKEKAQKLLKKLELNINPNTKVKDLSVAGRHMVEIVKALSMDAKIVIMDEPTSALSLREVEDLYKIIRQLKSEGKAIIFISHKFEEIQEIADHFSVLRDGRYIGEGRVSETSVDKIVEMMVGRTLDQMFPKIEVKPGEAVMQVNGLSQIGVFNDISFRLHKGEILGFFGLVGAGRSEVMRTIFGIDEKSAGDIEIFGKMVSPKSPKDAIAMGLAYVPEDRHEQGAIVDMNIRENITLPQLGKLSGGLFLNRKEEEKLTVSYGQKMEIRASGWEEKVNHLSGGNQQKVVLAKWLATEPRILILDEPTKGIDVATKAAVHKFVSELAAQGHAIIMVSSELPEILGMADNVIVMHEGIITGRYSREEADSETIIKDATGTQIAGGAQ